MFLASRNLESETKLLQYQTMDANTKRKIGRIFLVKVYQLFEQLEKFMQDNPGSYDWEIYSGCCGEEVFEIHGIERENHPDKSNHLIIN